MYIVVIHYLLYKYYNLVLLQNKTNKDQKNLDTFHLNILNRIQAILIHNHILYNISLMVCQYMSNKIPHISYIKEHITNIHMKFNYILNNLLYQNKDNKNSFKLNSYKVNSILMNILYMIKAKYYHICHNQLNNHYKNCMFHLNNNIQ